MKILVIIACCLLAACTPATAPTPDYAAEEKAILDMEAKWSTSKDADTFVSFYSEDVVVLPPNAPLASGRAAARAALAPLFATPGFALSFKSTKVEVARSGELAWSHGPYTLTMNGPKGEPITDKGKFVTVFRKQADGSWKTISDMFNSDLPAPAPPK